MLKKIALQFWGFIILFLCSTRLNAQQYGTWSYLGSPGFSTGSSIYEVVDHLDTIPYVAFWDYGASSIVVKRYINGTWTNVGGAVYNGAATSLPWDLEFSGTTPYVVYSDQTVNEKISVKKFDGTNWVYVGSSGITSSSTGGGNAMLIFLNSVPYLICGDYYDFEGATKVFKYTNGTWVNISSSSFTTSPQHVANQTIISDGANIYISYVDYTSGINKMFVKKYDGSTWTNVGTNGIVGSCNNRYGSICFHNSNLYACYSDSLYNNKLSLKKFDGTNWVYEGTPGFSNYSPQNYNRLSLNEYNSNMYVVYSRLSNSSGYRAVIMKYDGTIWTDISSQAPFNIGSSLDYFSVDYVNSKLILAYKDWSIGSKASVVKYQPCSSTTISNLSICASQLPYTINGVTFIGPGTIPVNLVNTTGCDSTVYLTLSILPSPTVNAGNDTAICEGQSITLNAIGATTYSWNNNISNGVSFTPTTTKTYTVVGASSNGCLDTDQVVVSVNKGPVVNAGVDQTICSGGSTTINGYGFELGCNGGVIPVSWSPVAQNGVPFSPSATSSYVLTGTATNGCTAKDTIKITVKTFKVTASNNYLCHLDSVLLTAPPSLTPYIWKKGNMVINNQSSNSYKVGVVGTYTVMLTDSLCGLRTSDAFSLIAKNNPPNPVLSPTGQLYVCPNDTVTIHAPAGYSNYYWYFNGTTDSFIINGLSDSVHQTTNYGAYYVRVRDSFGCASKYSTGLNITVSVPTPTISVTPAGTNKKKLTSITQYVQYQWNLNGNPISGATKKTYTTTTSGNYSLTVINNAGCIGTSPDTFINVALAKQSPKPSSDSKLSTYEFKVFPNPSNGEFIIESEIPVKAIVRDVQGKIVSEIINAEKVDLSNVQSGVYLLQLFNDNNEIVKSVKLMKE